MIPLRYVNTYLSSFFALPIQRASSVRLSHEEVINQLDNETVSYSVKLGFDAPQAFKDVVCVSIKVEIVHYDIAIAWLKDLVYGADFGEDR